MPHKRRSTFRRRRKRNFRRRRKRPFRNQQGALSLSLITPKLRLVKLRYKECIVYNPGVGVVSTNTFSCNSIFDPNVTGVGHQPYGADQMALLYNTYRVLGSKLVIQFSCNAPTELAVIVGITKNTDSSLILTGGLDAIMERPGVVTRMLPASTSMILSETFSLKQAFGKNSNALSFASSNDASPQSQMFYHIFVGSPDVASDPGKIVTVTTIDYIVQYSEPEVLTQS